MNLKLLIPTLAVALIGGSRQIRARDFGLEYNTEWQTSFRDKYNWVNLLRLSASLPVSHGLSVEASTISIAKTLSERLVDDLQTYSNIEEDNLPLTFATLGFQWEISRSTLFLGIRNVNEDYFTTPVTSLFANSSCGIFPTLSANYPSANYPLASWGLHWLYDHDNITLQASIYEGQGHKRLLGHDNIFTISPRREGLFFITSIDYNNDGSIYTLGCAVYHGVHSSDEETVEMAQEQTPQAAAGSKSTSVAPWVNVEQRLSSRFDLMLQASVSSASACRYYFGAGTRLSLRRNTLGLFIDYARFAEGGEMVIELTDRIHLSEHLHLQPVLQLIHTPSQHQYLTPVGLLRITYCI